MLDALRWGERRENEWVSVSQAVGTPPPCKLRPPSPIHHIPNLSIHAPERLPADEAREGQVVLLVNHVLVLVLLVGPRPLPQLAVCCFSWWVWSGERERMRGRLSAMPTPIIPSHRLYAPRLLALLLRLPLRLQLDAAVLGG